MLDADPCVDDLSDDTVYDAHWGESVDMETRRVLFRGFRSAKVVIAGAGHP